jgi:hypothetical protein
MMVRREKLLELSVISMLDTLTNSN